MTKYLETLTPNLNIQITNMLGASISGGIGSAVYVAIVSAEIARCYYRNRC